MMTPMYLTPFTKKHQPSPIFATRIPATAGPITRAPLNIEEFSAIAFIRSSRPTMSTRKDWRPGISNAFTTPSRAASTKICGTEIRCIRVSVARMRARIIDAVWVAMTIRCRLTRSATMPPMGANKNTGIWLANPTAPRRNDDPVSLYTSQDCATVCIQVPISEISCPEKKSWKLRCLSARMPTDHRDVPGNARAAFDAELEVPGSGTAIRCLCTDEYHYSRQMRHRCSTINLHASNYWGRPACGRLPGELSEILRPGGKVLRQARRSRPTQAQGTRWLRCNRLWTARRPRPERATDQREQLRHQVGAAEASSLLW